MALPATDSFTDTNGVQLTTHSASWTLNAGDFDIQSNALACDYPSDSLAHWNADTFNANQYAQATMVAVGSEYVGVAVRCAASAMTSYGYSGTSSAREIFKYVSGAYTTLASSGGLSVSDVVRLEANGTTITPKRNGSTDTGLGAQTDSSIASGYGGVSGYSDGTTTRVDDWSAGNLAAVTPVAVYKNDANLVALWLMEEASGTRYDAVGENDLTDNNTVGRSATAQEGTYSADFEASNSEYLSIADNAALSTASR